MKNVLYIGNALSNKGKTATSVETLGGRLQEFCNVKISSRKSNKVLRLLDMAGSVITNKSWADYVLIDIYSTTNFYYALVVSQLCKFFKIKYITILHGGNLESRLKNNPRLCGLVFKKAYGLVSPSNFLKNVFKNYGYNHVIFIPNTIEITDFEFQGRYFESINLLWVRSFSKIYNPKMAVFVLESILANGLDATLTMVGPEVDGTMQEVKLLAEKKKLTVDFTNKLNRQELITASNTCNIFINTTNFDNTPLSLIEAMALGLPIVSTNVGGIPYLVEDKGDGLLVQPNDIEAMAAAILRIKEDVELRKSIILSARKKAESFDWEVVKSKWETLLS